MTLDELREKIAKVIDAAGLYDTDTSPTVGEYAGLYKRQAQEDMLKGDNAGRWRKVVKE